MAGCSCKVHRVIKSPNISRGGTQNSQVQHSPCYIPVTPRLLKSHSATHRFHGRWCMFLIYFLNCSSGHLLSLSHHIQEVVAHIYLRTSSSPSFGPWMDDIVFSCKILSCHNLEYAIPLGLRHSKSLGCLMCLPFLFDKDHIQYPVWTQKRNSMYLCFVNRICSAGYFWHALS